MTGGFSDRRGLSRRRVVVRNKSVMVAGTEKNDRSMKFDDNEVEEKCTEYLQE